MTEQGFCGSTGTIKASDKLAAGVLALFVGTGFARSQCAVVLEAVNTGSYHLPNQGSGDAYYEAGRGDFGEARSFFIFNVPTFPAPLIAAELRLHAGSVWTTEGLVPFKLHAVETTPIIVGNYSAYTNTFTALADGMVLGSRGILETEGRRQVAEDMGAVISIPLNADGLNEIAVKEGDLVAFGGAVPDPFQGVVFGNIGLSQSKPELVLYFSNGGPPQVTAIRPAFSQVVLATDRVSLSAAVCGQTPLARQWFRNGVAVPNSTNEILEITSMSAEDAGSYQLVGANGAGIGGSDFRHLAFTPVRITCPDEIGVAEGATFSIIPLYTSRLPLTFQWRKNGVALTGQTGPTLTFNGIRAADAGEYSIVASNSSGSTSVTIDVRITVPLQPPVINDQEPFMRQVAVGLPLEIWLSVQGSQQIQFQWYRNGEAVPGATSNRLYIPSMGFNDAGELYLVAANTAGRSTSAVYQVTAEPLVIYALFSGGALWLNSFTFNPFVQSSVPVTAQWYFNDVSLPHGTNLSLNFPSFDYTNEGPYFLVASNIYGVRTSEVAVITVITQAPTASVNISASKVWIGENVTLSSFISGAPPPTVQWFFNDELIPGATNHQLVLTNVKTTEDGRYWIVASNIFGVETSMPVLLTVTADPPFFLQVPRQTDEVEGNIVTLRARAVAGPPPSYQWRKDGVDLPGQTNTSLELGYVRGTDSGIYEIVASNDLGEARYSHTLKVSPPTGLDRWQWRLPRAQGSRLYNVAWGNDRYVGVGKSGNCIMSSNGVDWTSATIETDTDLRLLAFGNGVFVTMGGTYSPLIITNQHKFPENQYHRFELTPFPVIVLVSSDGTTWEVAKNPDSVYFNDLAFGNGVFVALGGDSFCYTSLDGRTWAKVPDPAERRAYQILFGNGRFVTYASDGYIYHSSNGTDWTLSGRFGLNLEGFGNGRFIGRDSLGIHESANGVDWTHLGAPSFVYPNKRFAGAGGIFVGGLSAPAGQVAVSTDGFNWAPIDTGTRQEIEGVIHVNGQFLAVGEAGTVTRSVNGLTWTPDEVANKIDFYGLTHGKGLHVAAGDSGTILTSSNATDWVRRNTPTTRNLHAVTYGDGLFVAAGRGGALITSPDGLTWTARSSDMTNYIERIAWAEGLWVAVAEDGGIATSSNGIDWSAVNTGPPFTDHEGVAYGNGVWVAVGGYFNNPVTESQAVGTIYTSTNGANWTRLGLNPEKRWRDVTFGRGRFVAVGNDGFMSFSLNGIIWSQVISITNQNLRRVHYANGRFVVVGNDGTLMSSPLPLIGASWTKHRSRNSQNLHDIHAAPDGTFVFLGNNGMLLQSGNTRPRFLSISRSGRLEFDRGIAGTLRLERSSDLRTWHVEALDVVSPTDSQIVDISGFWRLAGD